MPTPFSSPPDAQRPEGADWLGAITEPAPDVLSAVGSDGRILHDTPSVAVVTGRDIADRSASPPATGHGRGARGPAWEEAQAEMLDRLARAAELRDDDTGQHTRRVGDLAARIGAALGLPADQVELLHRAAPLHDIGKIGVPDSVLRKPGPLTRRELRVMRSHTILGARILAGGRSGLVRAAEQIALSHHERWNGTGYPQRLRRDGIPLFARIVAVADCYDALTHDRVYRAAQPPERARGEILRERGKRYDPSVVDALLGLAAASRAADPLAGNVQ